ncbi:MAG: bifunctional riboflavin kinase/FAD synthetase [Lachnospiraceae bacterium]|nr:bifunctional riboflavin kinase/FAD synthetase [Lachnospiraceae bacterium]MDD3614613.1 bifunctional riboflavin kinase/FAD synthetase [Lachnospiraceae bacterium]
MEYITGTDDIHMKQECVVTFGKFDGVHRGHQKLISRVKKYAREGGYASVMFSFDVSPLIRIGNRTTQTILTNAEREYCVEHMGVDYLIEYPFTRKVIEMEPENFVREILCEKLQAAHVVVGPDFCFGHERRGNVAMLKQLGPRYGFTVDVVEKEKEQGREISSTFVREELQRGNMELVNNLLGYPYFVIGTVVHGRQLGRTMGLPTINQIPDSGKLLPPRGVYVSKTYIEGKKYHGITNIGCKPTVEGAFVGVETYLFDCNENLYEKEAQVTLLSYQRPEQKFSSVEELRAQILKDEQTGRNYFSRKTEHRKK